MIIYHFHIHLQFMYESFHIHYIISLLSLENKNSQLTLLPMCGSIAQLVEHRTSIAEVTVLNPVEALNCFKLLYANGLNWKLTAMIIYHVYILTERCNLKFTKIYLLDTTIRAIQGSSNFRNGQKPYGQISLGVGQGR